MAWYLNKIMDFEMCILQHLPNNYNNGIKLTVSVTA